MRLNLYGLSVLYGVQNAGLTFFFSPYLLEHGMSEAQIGLVFAYANVCSILSLLLFPRLVSRFGAHALFVGVSMLLFLSMVSAAFLSSPLFVALALAHTVALAAFMWSVLDIGFEHTMKNENETGRTRALYFTLLNIVFVAMPSIAGALVFVGGYALFFFMLALAMALLSVYGYYTFPSVPHTERSTHIQEMLDVVIESPHIRRVFSAQLLLQAFYGFMVVYMPIMLISTYGFTLSEMGTIFSVAMIAFLLIQAPVGYISDMWIGEKEIMILGFVILVLSTLTLPLLAGASLFMWSIVMFMTRIGAACVEITTESYFFKHVRSADTGAIAAYRMLTPLARLATPLLGTFFLTVAPMTAMPTALALCIAVIALIELPGLKDTR